MNNRKKSIIYALYDAKHKDKLIIVSMVSGIQENRLEQIIDTKEMDFSEEVTLGVLLEANP